MKIAVPDLISNSYLPAPAAVELGFFEKEGLDMTYELIFPVDDANKALRDGKVDFVGGSAHSTLAGFPEWQGAKLVCALSQGMYWFLVARKDLNITLGDAQALKGLNIGAAPWVDLGLRALLKEEGIDPDKDVNIAPIPGTVVPGVSFGVTAAAALEDGKIDAFWANGMGAEVAVTKGVGKIVLDPRRGVGPAASFNFTQPVFATTQTMIDEQPDSVAAAVRAIVSVQKAMKRDVSLATEVGRKSFPEAETALIAQVVERDLPFYDASITPDFVTGMNAFCRDMGLMTSDPAFEDIVATEFCNLW
ncbi:MAG: ABC transporter substrate-binding protein [Rhodospirillaceae bacterium]|nr:nitrate ABC transporter substrate-binding protein [Rhodospirillaceae bacterium]RPG03693.1 MAG: ABC transporter substrate-binding protein [Rhodospirillaceae bacterium TMED63]RZO36506.1 MAG: ABC transporter substrate-binding protein [Rhodospirillaceae bacterium]